MDAVDAGVDEQRVVRDILNGRRVVQVAAAVTFTGLHRPARSPDARKQAARSVLPNIGRGRVKGTPIERPRTGNRPSCSSAWRPARSLSLAEMRLVWLAMTGRLVTRPGHSRPCEQH